MTPAQKHELLERARAHYASGILYKGLLDQYDFGDFRGGSLGCLVHDLMPEIRSYDIDDMDRKEEIVAEHYGYPEWLAELQDRIFYSLPHKNFAKWHVQFAEALHALPDDYQWSQAFHRIHIAILLVAHKTAGPARQVVQHVIDLHSRVLRGEAMDEAVWDEALLNARRKHTKHIPEASAAAWSATESGRHRGSGKSVAWWRVAGRDAFLQMRDGILEAIGNAQTGHRP